MTNNHLVSYLNQRIEFEKKIFSENCEKFFSRFSQGGGAIIVNLFALKNVYNPPKPPFKRRVSLSPLEENTMRFGLWYNINEKNQNIKTS